jgi:hypothetical protein
MLEAVNSVLQSAPIVRQAVERTSASESFAANPEGTQRTVQAPFVSNYVFLDVNYDAAVILFRNRDTGDVIRQVPSESSLEAKRRELSREAQPAIHAPEPQETQDTGGSELGFVPSAVPAKQSTSSSQSSSTNAGVPATTQQLAAFDAGAKAAAPSSAGSQVSVLA